MDNKNDTIEPEVLEPEVIESTKYRYENNANHQNGFQTYTDMASAQNNQFMSEKSGNVAVLLCWLGGVLGIHRFYLGRIPSGILFILTGGFFGIGVFCDLVAIFLGALRDDKGKILRISNFFRIISGIWALIFIISFVFSIFTGAIGLIFGVIATFFALIMG